MSEDAFAERLVLGASDALAKEKVTGLFYELVKVCEGRPINITKMAVINLFITLIFSYAKDQDLNARERREYIDDLIWFIKKAVTDCYRDELTPPWEFKSRN